MFTEEAIDGLLRPGYRIVIIILIYIKLELFNQVLQKKMFDSSTF